MVVVVVAVVVVVVAAAAVVLVLVVVIVVAAFVRVVVIGGGGAGGVAELVVSFTYVTDSARKPRKWTLQRSAQGVESVVPSTCTRPGKFNDSLMLQVYGAVGFM